ncbi:hypothetical protein ACOME3_009441 [Neoechinorhynchus agilis]
MKRHICIKQIMQSTQEPKKTFMVSDLLNELAVKCEPQHRNKFEPNWLISSNSTTATNNHVVGGTNPKTTTMGHLNGAIIQPYNDNVLNNSTFDSVQSQISTAYSQANEVNEQQFFWRNQLFSLYVLNEYTKIVAAGRRPLSLFDSFEKTEGFSDLRLISLGRRNLSQIGGSTKSPMNGNALFRKRRAINMSENSKQSECDTKKRKLDNDSSIDPIIIQNEGVDKKMYGCRRCPKSYTTLGALKMHIRTHTLPCKCHICGKAFSRPWLLQGHLRTHTGEKPFKCAVCDRAFADRSNLRAHMQTHSDTKKYGCNLCAKTFSRMSLLTKHRENCSMTLQLSALKQEYQIN